MNTVESLLLIVEAVPELQKCEPRLVKEYFELIARYCPTLASEPLLIGPTLLAVIHMGHLDPNAMRALIETEIMMINGASRRVGRS